MISEQAMCIGGEWAASQKAETFNVVDPATSDGIARVPKASREGVARAVDAAREAFTGKRIMELAAASAKRVQPELGGKAPFIVFDDADLEAAAEGAVVGDS